MREDKAAELAKNEAAQDQASGEPSQPSSSVGAPGGQGSEEAVVHILQVISVIQVGGKHPATTLRGSPPSTRPHQ